MLKDFFHSQSVIPKDEAGFYSFHGKLFFDSDEFFSSPLECMCYFVDMEKNYPNYYVSVAINDAELCAKLNRKHRNTPFLPMFRRWKLTPESLLRRQSSMLEFMMGPGKWVRMKLQLVSNSYSRESQKNFFKNEIIRMENSDGIIVEKGGKK